MAAPDRPHRSDERVAADDFQPGPSGPTLARPVYSGGNRVRLLQGGDDLFPAMREAIGAATHDIWLATYIFHDDPTALAVLDALCVAARRGVSVQLVVDGFGSKATIPALERRIAEQGGGVKLAVFRPLRGWLMWMNPGHLRRLHLKLCTVDSGVAFVGGVNLIDDRVDLRHGASELPRLDFAVRLEGPSVEPVERAVRAVWTRASLGHDLRDEVVALARSSEPLSRLRQLVRELRMPHEKGRKGDVGALPPVRVAFVLRDNLRQRRTIERSYIAALRGARESIDVCVSYFYPGHGFRVALRQAARRGVRVRLLLQGKLDYRIAGMAARALYDELLGHGVRIYEYMPAYLHAKIAVVDGDWATVGSSNIDPLSLLLNLEANVLVNDADFNRELAARFERALADSHEIDAQRLRERGLPGAARRAFVAWVAYVYLRLAGATGRYCGRRPRHAEADFRLPRSPRTAA